MSVIGKWALQAVVVFVFAWMATVAAQWSASVVRSTSSDRLAAIGSIRLTTTAMAVSLDKKAQADAVAVGTLSESNE